jgi:LysM repeat protein
MSCSFFHIGNALKNHHDAVLNTSGLIGQNSLKSNLNNEMNIFSRNLVSLLAMDKVTTSNFMPSFTQCSVNITPNLKPGLSKYTVGKGDTLESISAEKTGNQATANHLMLWNGLKNDKVEPGQSLMLNNPNTHTINIHLHFDDFLENILHPDYLKTPQTSQTPQASTTASVNHFITAQEVDYSKPLNLQGILPSPVRQQAGTNDCFFANLSWCDQFYGNHKSLEDFRTIFKTLYPKDEIGAVHNQPQMWKLAASEFTYDGIRSEAGFIEAIANNHPILTNGHWDGDLNGSGHSLIIIGLTFDKNKHIKYFKVIDPNSEINWISANQMESEIILNIVITGLKKPN